MTDEADLGCGADVLNRFGERCATCWCGCKIEDHGVGCKKQEVSKHVLLVVAAERDGEMRNG